MDSDAAACPPKKKEKRKKVGEGEGPTSARFLFVRQTQGLVKKLLPTLLLVADEIRLTSNFMSVIASKIVSNS